MHCSFHDVRCICAAIALSFTLTTAALANPKSFTIESQDASRALLEFGRQSAVQILFASEKVKGIVTNAVHGNYEPIDALKLLLKGTPLIVSEKSDGVLVVELPAIHSAASQIISPGDQASDKEAGKQSSQDFRLGEVDPGTAGPQAVDTRSSEKKKQEGLTEIVVTGSRLKQSQSDSAQQVSVYNRETIEQSGRGTVSEFLNSLPDVSVALADNALQTGYGQTTVQLHGLPVGTTLVLINGRRVETGGLAGAPGQKSFFDLNNIPLAAIERIEVISEGSSAVYGSDAIAGVVNIILKKSIDGFQFDLRHGFASGLGDTTGSAAWGTQWDRGSVLILASFEKRGELDGSERSITANNDYTQYGGPDTRVQSCNPGNVFSVDGSPLPGAPGGQTYAAVSPTATGNPRATGFQGTYGALNECSSGTANSIVTPDRREGFLAQANYKLTDSTEVFGEFLYSHDELQFFTAPPSLYAVPGYVQYTVPASNAYNPFGTAVGVGYQFTDLARFQIDTRTQFYRPLLGARGAFSSNWNWEVAAWMAADDVDSHIYNAGTDPTVLQNALDSSDPATAINPFVATAPASPALLASLNAAALNSYAVYHGQTIGSNGFVRGSLLDLPAGPLDVVLGAEFTRDKLSFDYVNSYFSSPVNAATYKRNNYAVFGEARIPVLGMHEYLSGQNLLAVTTAARYDDYEGYGGKVTPQFGAELRPLQGLLVRATYGKAFRAPSLVQLFGPTQTFLQPVVDPKSGQSINVSGIQGGNRNLNPETGESRTLGFVFSPSSVRSLRLSVTYWSIDEDNSIQQISPQTIVDNENIFPEDVIRGPSVNGQPGPITTVKASYLNYGAIQVRGLDYAISDKIATAIGELQLSAGATQTFRYTAALIPGSPPTDRTSIANDDGNFSPRWKGVSSVGIKHAALSATLSARYVGKYQDYDSTRLIGNDWYFDANIRYAVGEAFANNNQWFRKSYVTAGAINAFNRLPKFSNYDFGYIGYDPAEADIRGRYLYLQAGLSF